MRVGPNEYKDALRRFASGVSIVTVEFEGEVHGMTATSFASVSLDPPLILICLEKASRTLSLVREARRFAVNVLAEVQEDLARKFAQHGEKPFGEVDYQTGVTHAPLLHGAIAWIECDERELINGGDHDIVVGEVIACRSHPGKPLVYFNRGYRRFGSKDLS